MPDNALIQILPANQKIARNQPFAFREYGLEFNSRFQLSVSDITDLIGRLDGARTYLKFCIGDALLHGERLHGENFYPLDGLSIERYSPAYCDQIKSAVKNIARENRPLAFELDWSHSRAVAALSDPQEQREVLEQVRTNGNTVRETRVEVARRRSAKNGKSAEAPRITTPFRFEFRPPKNRENEKQHRAELMMDLEEALKDYYDPESRAVKAVGRRLKK